MKTHTSMTLGRRLLRWTKAVAATTLLAMSSAAVAGPTIGSWNLLQAGWQNGKQMDKVAAVAQHMDLIGLQEVMEGGVVGDLERRLESLTGDEWGSLVSREVGRGSYQEQYAFLYREDVIGYDDGAAVYLDTQDVFSREPLLASFRVKDSGKRFTAANVHILYGDSKADRTPEIRALADIYDLMKEMAPDQPAIIMGDFNMAPSEPAWRDVRALGLRPLVTRGATTLSSANGRYANLYDNIWHVPSEWPKASGGIFRFPQYLGMTHKMARDVVSDHAPVYMSLDGSKLALVPHTSKSAAQTATPGRTMAGSTGGSSCIDLNRASAQQLDRLPNVGPARAAAIIDRRPWQSASQLTRIKGIGKGRLKQILSSGLLCS